MHPELFHVNGVVVYAYGFFIFLGMLFAYFYLKSEWQKKSLGTIAVNEVFLLSIGGVFLGGKIFYFLESPGFFLRHPQAFLQTMGSGFVFYGSFLVTIPLLIYYFKKRNLNPWEQFDLAGICGAMVHGFGKIGCFMAGCCYGKVSNDSWYSVEFSNPQSSARPLNQPLYATQLWDALLIFSILAIMLIVKPKKQFHGQLFLIYTILYASGRFLTENFRGDEARGFLFDGLLSHSQFMAIIIISFCLLIYYYRRRNVALE